MQITFTFRTNEILSLPIHYNHLVQGFIYHSIDQDLASFLHEQGFMVNQRTFKLFVFSRILGNYYIDQKNGNIHFGSPFKLVIASPLDYFCRSLCQCILQRGALWIGNTPFEDIEVSIDEPRVKTDIIEISTLSPITVYSTLLKADGRKYTCYFQPGEPEFNHLITENIKKKYEAIYRTNSPEGNITVSTRRPAKLNIINYKGTIVKGYSGKMRLHGPAELLQIGLDAGLGSKNSQGFGCIELFRR